MLDIHLGFIGAGHLASALVNAFSAVLPAGNITLSCPVPEELELFAAMGCCTGGDNRETVLRSDLTVLIVRPGVMETVLREIAPVCAGRCFLSVAAGISVGYIRRFLPGASVMRAMPNTPASVGSGATALCIPGDVPEKMAKAAAELFESAGAVELVEEKLFDAVTALSGSSPAYFFRMAAVMTDWASERGMDRGAALRLVSATMAGAAKMLELSGRNPERLAADVAVPGGTTVAAFDVLDRTGWNDALRAAMSACTERSFELGK